jgi:NitT/TauT family transport system substrate-binding protein
MKSLMLKRRDPFWHLTFLVALAGFGCLLSFNPARSQQLTKLKIGYSGTGNTQYILELPRRQGVFRKNGLDTEIVYVTSGSLLSQALIAGNFDVALTRGTTPMLGKLRGSEQLIVANYSNHFNDVFLAAPEITAVKQLKGKRIAVSRFGSGSHILTNLVLKQAGLDPQRDVTVLQIGNSAARLAAIMSRSIEGSLISIDFVPRARREGLHVLVDLTESKVEYPVLSFFMMGPVIEHNRRTVKALIKSISEGVRIFQTDVVAAKAVIKAALRTDDPETLELTASRVGKSLEYKPVPTVAAIQTALDELRAIDPAKVQTAKFDDFVDLRAVRELEQEGFFK